MDRRLLELGAEAEIAGMECRKALEQEEIPLHLEEAEGTIRVSSICPSLMSFILKEDKNSEIKSWLDQGIEDFDKCFSQPKESSREVENKGECSKPAQKFQTFDHKNQLTRVQSRGTSKSPQRKITGNTFPKTNILLQQGKEKSKNKIIFAKTSFKL